jgi:hypothetical protein
MHKDNDTILANALLGCYLDDLCAEEIAQVCDRHNVIMGESEFYAAMDQAMGWLETGENLEQLTRENRQKFVDKGVTFFVQELGAIPGKDISPAGYGGFLVSNALMNKIGTIPRQKLLSMANFPTRRISSAESPDYWGVNWDFVMEWFTQQEY